MNELSFYHNTYKTSANHTITKNNINLVRIELSLLTEDCSHSSDILYKWNGNRVGVLACFLICNPFKTLVGRPGRINPYRVAEKRYNRELYSI